MARATPCSKLAFGLSQTRCAIAVSFATVASSTGRRKARVVKRASTSVA